MHGEAWVWVQHSRGQMRNAGKVIEIGSYNHNGTARDLFQPISSQYLGVDIISGPGVDFVGNINDSSAVSHIIETFGKAETIVSTETLEHTPAQPLIEAMMKLFDSSKDVLHLVITCAGFQRIPHSYDGGPLKPGEWYANVNPDELKKYIEDAFVSTGLSATHDLQLQLAWNKDVARDTYAYADIVKK